MHMDLCCVVDIKTQVFEGSIFDWKNADELGCRSHAHGCTHFKQHKSVLVFMSSYPV